MLEIMICPHCKSKLELFPFERGESDEGGITIDQQGEEVISGILKCGCGIYPIIDGVPRFLEGGIERFPKFIDQHREQLKGGYDFQHIKSCPVSTDAVDNFENIRKSFSQEWGLFDYSCDRTWGWTLDERKATFCGDMNLKTHELAGKLLLDAGCGNGTLTAALSDFGLNVVGLDLNDGLGLAYRNRAKYAKQAKKSVQYVQGNLVQPPLQENTFDLVYSSGVIHHTPSSKEAFDSLVRLTKKGGRLYIWVYGKRALPVRMFFWTGRSLKRVISLKSLGRVCRILAPGYKVATQILDLSGVSKFQSRTTREITLALFDAFAPRFNHWHTETEVQSWFQSHGFKNISVSARHKQGFGMYGDRL